MVNLFTVLLHGVQGEEYPRFEKENSEFQAIKTVRYADCIATVNVGDRVLQIVPFLMEKEAYCLLRFVISVSPAKVRSRVLWLYSTRHP